MKTLQDLNISIIKPVHKEGNDNIKALLYKANEIIYPNTRTYISTRRKNRILSEFIEIGKQLSTTEATERQNAKKQEILTILRDYCNKLKRYDSDDDEEQCKRVVKYTVAQFLRERDNYNTDEEIISAMQRNIDICADYIPSTSLKKAQDELIEMFVAKYKIGA